MLRKTYVLEKNQQVFLSTLGYYGYYYRGRSQDHKIKFDQNVIGQELNWTNEKGWKAILLSHELLCKYPDRICNVIWIKE